MWCCCCGQRSGVEGLDDEVGEDGRQAGSGEGEGMCLGEVVRTEGGGEGGG
jgi:hypothetical protein